MAGHNRRRSSIDPASVQSILTAGASGEPAASPTAHVGNSPNRPYFPMSPPPRQLVKHTRALSYTPRRPNRLSLSFPVATGSNPSESTRPTPTSSNASSFPQTPLDAPTPSPNDPSGFLVALASQERRVLELKEELQKAETDLVKLKSQWASHERTRKRAEIRHSEPLQSLQTVVTDSGRSSEDTDGSTRQSTELDRRRALLTNLPRESRRKVITGGHTRALSLLSPDRSNYTQPFPTVQESRVEENNDFPKPTMPDTSQGITKVSANRSRNSYQGGVTHGAKQIAEDVKAGLWTFLEDLRQATVGDEAVHGTPSQFSTDAAQSDPRKRSSKNNLSSSEKGRNSHSAKTTSPPRTWDSLTGTNLGLGLSNTTESLWQAENQIIPRTLAASKQKGTGPSPLVSQFDELDDDWSNWDSPTPKSPRWSGSTELSDPVTPSHIAGENRPIRYLFRCCFHACETDKRQNCRSVGRRSKCTFQVGRDSVASSRQTHTRQFKKNRIHYHERVGEDHNPACRRTPGFHSPNRCQWNGSH